MRTKAKWLVARGAHTITRVEESNGSRPYVGTDGKTYPDHPVTTTRIVAWAGDVLVMTLTMSGTHPMTRANYREVMARKVMDAGGSWLGRTNATENAKADARIARMYDPRVTPDTTDRTALRDAYYGGMPHPSSF